MKLKRVEEWTKGKPQFPALASVFLVVHANMFYGSMKLFADGRRSKDKFYGSREWIACHKIYTMLFRVRDIGAWSRLYTRLLDELPSADRFGAFADLPIVQALPELVAAFGNVKSLNDLNQPPIVGWIRTHLLADFNRVEDGMGGEERLRSLAPVLESAYGAFVFKVFIPCIVYYQSTPAMLVRKALAGDLDSLDDLLTLDKNLLNVPEVYTVWEPISRNPDSADFTQLMSAMNRSPHRGLKPTGVKIAIAAGIESIFKAMGQPISRTNIRDLFDRYAQDVNHVIIDEDLPETENGFDEAVRREINGWKAAAQACE